MEWSQETVNTTMLDRDGWNDAINSSLHNDSKKSPIYMLGRSRTRSTKVGEEGQVCVSNHAWNLPHIQ